MVCQGASQTKFRALKHENGMAGRPTIIVRVIACFQPLQDCQAEYFRQLLKPITTQKVIERDPFSWMVKANNSFPFTQHSARKLPYLNRTSMLLEHVQHECFPSSTNEGTWPVSGHMALPASTVSGIRSLNAKEANKDRGLLQYLPPHLQTLLPPPNSYLHEKQSPFSFEFGGGMAVPNANPGSSQKGFFIFDQSGNETRLIYNSVCPPSQYPPMASAKLGCGYDSHKLGQTTSMDQIGPTKCFLFEETGENHIIEESEMHEDTEEINALLYSDDDDDDDDCGEDDEVKSTGHSPFCCQENYGKNEDVEEVAEKMFSSESDPPNKRHKLLDGGYVQLSPVKTVINSLQLDKSHEYGNNTESSNTLGQSQGEEASWSKGKMKSKTDKICETVRVLESLIPGAKGKNPVLIIDEAIDYLKSMKLKAETLGVSFH
ncbi:hypothetical protein ACFX15_031289 [Malus domestica]